PGSCRTVNGALVLAGLFMGVASSPHCAAMCSAPCAALTRSCDPARPRKALAAWHLGRLVAYGSAGALASASVAWLAGAAAASAVVRPVWTMAQAAVLVLGLVLLCSGRTPRALDAVAARFAHAVRPAQTVRFMP